MSRNSNSGNATCSANNTAIDDSGSCTLSETARLVVYAVMILVTVIIHFVRGVAFYFVCINASRTLHNGMFSNILRTPVLFFDTNPSGKFVYV